MKQIIQNESQCTIQDELSRYSLLNKKLMITNLLPP